VSEARLALAEIAFVSAHDHGAAGAYLKAAYETPHTEADSERAAYLAIFLADAPDHRDDQKTIELCRKFIVQNGGSNLLPDVRMKLGQVYFRLEDFANAQTLFETLANEDPDSPLAENALFLAGQSAMKTMNPTSLDHAIELFESVAKLNGPLKLYARQEQAIAKSKAGKESEAIILYNDILGANPDDELKFAVMCGKGDAFFAMGNGGANFFEQAIAAFGALDAQPGAPAQWRNQALYKKGKCLEKLGRISDALVAFYDVLNTKAVTTPEYLWYYKAGFDAARLLEAQQQWKSAIGIYQKIAAVEGPRAQEAKTRALQLRLEHFIWEE
jgi:tetratricopeptide (TPR) repeat protein